MNRLSFAGILFASLTFTGLVRAQDGPDSVLRGTKEFRRSVLVSGLGRALGTDLGTRQHALGDRADRQAHHAHRSGQRPADRCHHDRRSFRARQPGRTAGYGAPPRTAARHRQRLRLCRLHLRGPKQGANPCFPDAASPYRYLYGKIVRFTYDRTTGTLSKPVDLIAGLPVWQRPRVRASEVRSGQKAVFHDRRPGPQSARQFLPAHRGPTPADARRDRPQGLHPLIWANRCV